MRCLRLSGALAYGDEATPMTRAASRKLSVPSRRPKPSTASMNPADQLRRRNSPSVTDGRPSDSWNATISRMHSSCSFLNCISPSLLSLCARAACNRRSGRRKLPICSTRNGGLIRRSSPDHRLDEDLDAAIGLAAAFRIVARHRLALPLAEGREPQRADAPGLEILRHRHTAPLPTPLVVLVRTHVVGMPDDRQRGFPIAHHHVGELVQRAMETRLDVHRVGVERGLAGHGDAHHVVGQLFDARLAGLDLLVQVFLEVALLAVHVSAHGASGKASAHSADERALGAVLVISHRTHDGAADCADEGAALQVGERPVAGPAAIARATGKCDAEHQDRFDVRVHCASALRIFAPSTIAFIFPKATSRGRYFIPQSGATMTSSGFTCSSALLIRSTTFCGVSTVMSERSMQPTMIFLPRSFSSTAVSRFDCAASIETCWQEQPASSGRKE